MGQNWAWPTWESVLQYPPRVMLFSPGGVLQGSIFKAMFVELMVEHTVSLRLCHLIIFCKMYYGETLHIQMKN